MLSNFCWCHMEQKNQPTKPCLNSQSIIMDWMFVSPLKFLCWNLTSNVMIFRGEAFDGWLGRECEALMHRIRALLQETPESSLILFLPCEDTSRRQTLTRYRICGTLILDFPASRTVRSKSFLFKPPSLQHFVTAVREQRHVQNCETLYKVVLNH